MANGWASVLDAVCGVSRCNVLRRNLEEDLEAGMFCDPKITGYTITDWPNLLGKGVGGCIASQAFGI